MIGILYIYQKKTNSFRFLEIILRPYMFEIAVSMHSRTAITCIPANLLFCLSYFCYLLLDIQFLFFFLFMEDNQMEFGGNFSCILYVKNQFISIYVFVCQNIESFRFFSSSFLFLFFSISMVEVAFFKYDAIYYFLQ